MIICLAFDSKMRRETTIKKWVVSKNDECKIKPFYCRLQGKKVYKRRQ